MVFPLVPVTPIIIRSRAGNPKKAAARRAMTARMVPAAIRVWTTVWARASGMKCSQSSPTAPLSTASAAWA